MPPQGKGPLRLEGSRGRDRGRGLNGGTSGAWHGLRSASLVYFLTTSLCLARGLTVLCLFVYRRIIPERRASKSRAPEIASPSRVASWTRWRRLSSGAPGCRGIVSVASRVSSVHRGPGSPDPAFAGCSLPSSVCVHRELCVSASPHPPELGRPSRREPRLAKQGALAGAARREHRPAAVSRAPWRRPTHRKPASHPS